MHYHVGNNMPGYLPDDDNISYVFTTSDDAKQALGEDLDRASDAYNDDPSEGNDAIVAEYSAAMEDLTIADVTNGYLVYLPTSNSPHDLGRAYWIAICNDDCEEETDGNV